MISTSGFCSLQVAADAGDRPAGADAGDEVGDPARGLAPDLRAGGVVVGLRVGRVAVLVGLEGAGDLLGQAVGDAVVGLRGLGVDVGRRDHDLGAQRAQQVDLLARHLVGHDRDDAVALQPGGDREAGAGVAGGRLDDRPAGAEAAVALGGVDQVDRDPVLDRAAGVEQLELGDELRRQAGADAAEPDERRVADRVEDRVPDVGVGHGAECTGGEFGGPLPYREACAPSSPPSSCCSSCPRRRPPAATR